MTDCAWMQVEQATKKLLATIEARLLSSSQMYRLFLAFSVTGEKNTITALYFGLYFPANKVS